MPDRETVRPNLERTGSPALLPLDSGSPRNNLGLARSPLGHSPCAGMTLGRASAVWLAFVGGASVCPASEPCSYNGLNNRVSAAFRPSSQTSLTTCGGHRRRVVCWRPRVVPLAAVLYSIFLQRLRKVELDLSRRGDSSFPGADPMAVGSAHSCCYTTYVCYASCCQM